MKPQRAPVESAWFEPIHEGLWRVDLLFDVPRFANFVHVVFGILAISDSLNWLFAAAFVHAVMVGATMVEPEWPQLLNDLFVEPNELEA